MVIQVNENIGGNCPAHGPWCGTITCPDCAAREADTIVLYVGMGVAALIGIVYILIAHRYAMAIVQ